MASISRFHVRSLWYWTILLAHPELGFQELYNSLYYLWVIRDDDDPPIQPCSWCLHGFHGETWLRSHQVVSFGDRLESYFHTWNGGENYRCKLWGKHWFRQPITYRYTHQFNFIDRRWMLWRALAMPAGIIWLGYQVCLPVSILLDLIYWEL